MDDAGINGRLDDAGISGRLESVKNIRGNIFCGINRIEEYESLPVYSGNYEVVSKANEDSYLETKNKKLTDNIHVKEIPYFETTNLSDGLTVYIGSEVEFE